MGAWQVPLSAVIVRGSSGHYGRLNSASWTAGGMEVVLQGGPSTALIDEVLNEAIAFVYELSAALIKLVVAIYRPVAMAMAVVGAFLYFTSLHRRLGAQLLRGAIALVLFMELGIPAASYVAERLGWGSFSVS